METDTTPLNLLVLEDDAVISEVLRMALQDVNANLHMASTIREAEGKIQEVWPDLAVIDIGLPDGDGFEFAKKTFPKGGGKREVEIVFLTGNNNRNLRLGTFTLNTLDYITKPFSVAEFSLKIENILDLLSRKRSTMEHALIGNVEPQQNRLIQKLLDICEQNCSNPGFGINEAAEQLNVSVRSMQRILQTNMNRSFSNILFETRMRLAKGLLSNNIEPKRVAGMCGYRHPENFFTAFKKSENLTPRQFQKKHMEE